MKRVFGFAKVRYRGLEHIPIIDANPRRDAARKQELQAEAQRRKLLNFNCAEDVRYRERTAVERANARLKDELGGRTCACAAMSKLCAILCSVSLRRPRVGFCDWSRRPPAANRIEDSRQNAPSTVAAWLK